MELQNQNKTKCLRRSMSLRECDTIRNRKQSPCPMTGVNLAEQFGSVSKSADDILMDISHMTDVKQHGVVVFFNGFYQSSAVQTLVGTGLERTMETFRDRSKSFHDKPRVKHGGNNRMTFTSPMKKGQSVEKNGNNISISAAPKQQIVHDSNNRRCESGKNKDGVQLKRCLSLYDRHRKPHSCFSHTSKTTISKPSPWTYGSTYDRDTRKSNRKSPASTSCVMRHSVSDSFDLPDVGSKQSNKRSIDYSIVSSDSDLSTSVSSRPQCQGRTSPPKIPNCKQTRLSQIPRPSRPQSAPPYRHEPFTTKTTNKSSGSVTPKVSSKPLKRSISMTGKMATSATKTVPRTAKSIISRTISPCGRNSEDNFSSDSLDTDDAWCLSKTKPVFVPESEEDYPDNRPSQRPKADLFTPRDYTEIDRHALKAHDSLLESFDELLDYLLKDLNSELARLRVIYRWVISQNIPLELNPKQIVPNTPLGFLYNIREKRATYPELFATMCRRADIPCVIVYGIAKSIAYDVGDKVTHKKMKNSWNAVFVDGEWRVVHPYWARQSVRGYNSGCWAVVECDDFHDENGSESRQLIAQSANDFFFLTDPDKFITKCFPDDPSWQLLQKHLTKADFEDLPFLQPAFYELDLKIRNHHSCIIRTDNGKAELCIEMPREKVNRYRFKYKLFIHRDWEAEGEYGQILLDRYLLHYVESDLAIFEIRFPVSGMYKLELHCYDSKRTLSSNWICDFKIICNEHMPDCQPLPVIPSIGWGPNPALENAGMECLTHKIGVMNIDAEPVTFLRFAISKDKEVSVDAELLANKTSWAELQNHVTVEQDEEHAVVKVSPPTEGEYALQVYVQDRDSEKRQNVCNFLMHRTQIVEDPELADIRKELVQATSAGELDGLTLWIDRFIEKNMEDRGDLTAAKKKLHLAKVNRDIKEAIARKDLSLLEKTMHSCSDTSLRRSLGELAGEAEAMRSRLRRLKRLQHAVLDMDQKTISEMRSYPKPPPAVHGVMAATFMLLGHRESQLKKWSKIQGLISKRGKESVKRRVADFRTEDVSIAVLTRVRAILAKYDLETVQIASIGAATFYQWASTMAGETGV